MGAGMPCFQLLIVLSVSLIKNASNVLTPEIAAALSILKRCPPQFLMNMYKLGSFQTPVQFLFLLARKRGKLLKGGTADIEAASRVLIVDWNSGAIPFYCRPPVVKTTQHDSKAIVSSWGQTFNIDQSSNLVIPNVQSSIQVCSPHRSHRTKNSDQ